MVLASKFFLPTKKQDQVPADLKKAHKLMLRCGMISQIGSGLYFWLPLGKLLLDKISSVVHKYAKKMGFNDCLCTNLHPSELWKESKRYDVYGKEMMRLTDRHDKEIILGPTAEEPFLDIVRKFAKHAKDLPVNLYNIQSKFRDEIRPVGGLDRAREFIMFDGYSFHASEKESRDFYWHVSDGYKEMFKEISLSPEIVEADTGEIGGDLSHEFLINGEFEVGHIFYLGTKYTEPMKLIIGGEPVQMGCYGIGVSRLASVATEVFGDANGKIHWPKSIAPFPLHVIAPSEACNLLEAKYPEAYYEDRSLGFGEKLAIADLVGAPNRVILGERGLAEGFVEVNEQKIECNNPKEKLQEIVGGFIHL